MIVMVIHKNSKETFYFQTEDEAEQFLIYLRKQYLESCGYKELYRLKKRIANYLNRSPDEINEYYVNSLEKKYNRLKLDLSDQNHSVKVIIEK